jgi:hypothetical protein
VIAVVQWIYFQQIEQPDFCGWNILRGEAGVFCNHAFRKVNDICFFLQDVKCGQLFISEGITVVAANVQ